MVKTTSNIENEKGKLNKLIEKSISSGNELVSKEVLEQSKLIDRLVVNISDRKYASDSSKMLEKYFSSIYDELHLYINSITRGRVPTEDIIQNTVLSLYKNVKHINNYSSFKEYIFRIAEHEAAKALIGIKKDVLMLKYKLNDCQHINESIPEDLLIEKEIKKALSSAINNLNPKLRNVILYKYFANLSLKQISRLMDASLSSVNEWHKKAKKEIEESIQDIIMS